MDYYIAMYMRSCDHHQQLEGLAKILHSKCMHAFKIMTWEASYYIMMLCTCGKDLDAPKVTVVIYNTAYAGIVHPFLGEVIL